MLGLIGLPIFDERFLRPVTLYLGKLLIFIFTYLPFSQNVLVLKYSYTDIVHWIGSQAPEFSPHTIFNSKADSCRSQ